MKAVCPNGCKLNQFLTTAHVSQTWIVDNKGEFIEERSTDETTHGPDPDNEWICCSCGAVAEVSS